MKLLELFEADTKHITFVFGRLNPPTIGHKQLLDTAAKVGGDYKIFVSPSQDKKDNPLDYSTKIKFIKAIIPEHAKAIVEDPGLNTPVKIASYLYDQGYRAVTFVAGSDRLESMKKLLEMYNGVEGKAHGYYKFDVLDFKSSGEREDGAEGVAGISASRARSMAAGGDLEGFAEATGAGQYAEKLYIAVRKGMGINESTLEANPNQQISIYKSDGKTYRQQPMPSLEKDPVDDADPLDILKNEPYETDFSKEELKRIIAKNFEKLNDQQRKVLKARFWLGMTLDEVSEKMKLSPERIRQIEARAIRILRQSLGVEKEKDYVESVEEGWKSKMAGAALAAANLLGSPAQAAEEPIKPITIAYVMIDGEVRKYNLGDKFDNAKEAEKFISGVLDKQGLQGYQLEIKHGYPKKKEVKEAPIEMDPTDPMDPMIYGAGGNPAKLKYRMMRAAGQIKDLASRVDNAGPSEWQTMARQFDELKMNVEQIRHALEELAKVRKKGGIRSRGIDPMLDHIEK